MARIQKKIGAEARKKKKSEAEQVDLRSGRDEKPSLAPRKVVKQASVSNEVAPGKVGFFRKGSDFLREVASELKKVVWPTRKQAAGVTLVVLIFVFVVAAFLGLFDYALSKIVQIILT